MNSFKFENKNIIEVKNNTTNNQGNINFCAPEEFASLIKDLSLKYYHHKEKKFCYIKNQNDTTIGNIVTTLVTSTKNIKFLIKDNQIYIDLTNKEDVNIIIKILIAHLNDMEIEINSIYYLLYFIIDEVIQKYYSQNNDIEKQLQLIESDIFANKNYKKNNYDTYQIYHQVSEIRFHLTSVESAIEKLNLISQQEEHPYLNYLETTISHLHSETSLILDQIIQIQELFQNQVDISLNDSMNVFSIVATIFLPLTLITGWYGMNFKMPEYESKYGYLIPIAIMIIFLAITIYLIVKFQRRNKRNN